MCSSCAGCACPSSRGSGSGPAVLELRLLSAAASGLCFSAAVIALAGGPSTSPAAAWLRRRGAPHPHQAWLEISKRWRPGRGAGSLLDPLRARLERAGWPGDAEAVLAATLAATVAAAAAGFVLGALA